MLLRKNVLCKVLSVLLSLFLVCSMLIVPQTTVYAGMSPEGYGLPSFTGTGAVPEPTAFINNNMMQSIYDADMAAGGTSFWMDRMLARPGNDPSTADNQGNMLSKGRSIWMGWHDPSKLGFVGEVAYIDESDRDQSLSKTDGVSGYTIDLTSNGLTEDVSKRISYPSYWTSEYNDANGLNVNIKKFFTENNVAVSVLNIKNNSAAAKNITMTVTSPRAKNPSGDELTGEYKAPRGLTTVYPRICGDGLTASGSTLTGTFSVAAGQTVSKKVVMGFITNEIPESATDYNRFKGYDPNTAFTTQVREYNSWWGDNIPYIDVPDQNIKKMIYYRWWLDRFNLQDNELPISKGYAFPTSVEGVTGYNNAITLPLPWMLEESRYLRNPDLNYGTWLSMGATAGGGAFKDNPGNAPFWNYGPEMKAFVQYITKAGWESYKVFGGQEAILSKFADYGYNDVKDFMQKYDSNNDFIITLPDGSWTGFDSDSPVTKYFNGNGGAGATGGPVDSLGSAYEFANAQAASEMYSLIGNTSKADEMSSLANNIKNAVLTKMWDSTKEEFLHKAVNSSELNPWKDITNFYPYTMGLVPTNEAAYKEMFKLWTNPDDFVVWPALIGDIKDSAAAEAAGKAMTYNSAPSSMGVTLSFLAKAVKDYPSPSNYITADMYKQLLYWGAWGMYVGGNTDYPDANEFWSDVTDTSMGYRSWIHHNMHSKYNVSIIEDVAGLTPRVDNSIELDPIDIGWTHFIVNNMRYHGSDMSIIWNGDNYYNGIPQGYSVYLNGTRMFTIESLKHLVWNASTGEVTFPEGDTVSVSYNVSNPSFLTADAVNYSNNRVADMFKKVGLNIAGTDSVTGVSLNSTETLYVNETKQLTANVEPASAQNQAVTWHSDNLGIASIDEYGYITGVSEGQATITATTVDGGFSETCTVNVSQANAGDLSNITLDKNQMSLSTNDTSKITASFQGGFNELTNMALNKRGTGYPTPSASYTCGGDNAWFAVNGDDNSGLRWTSWNSRNASDWFQIDFGTSKNVNRLALDFYNDGGGVVPPASYKVQYWNGTAFTDVQNMIQSPATPSGTSQNVVYFDTVNTQKIQVVMTNKNPVDMGSYVGLREIGAFYDPYYSQSLSWSSDQPTVATVDQNGNVTAKSAGVANVTVTTLDSKHQAQCTVTVSAVNKALLSQKISYAQGLIEGDFTSESWTVLQTALSSAEAVNTQTGATQTVVDAALSSLKAAISSLKYQTDHSTIDFSNNGTGTLDFGGGDQVKRFQTFIARPGYFNVTGIDVKIIDNNANSNATFELYNVGSDGMPTGSALASATVSKADVDSSISQNDGLVHVNLNYSGLTAGNKYAIALGQVTTSDVGHDYKWYSSADTSNPDWWHSDVINPQIQQDGQNVTSGKYDGTNWIDESRLGDYWLKVYTHVVDKITLSQKISDAQGLAEENYTPDSWTSLQGALSTAVDINNKADATQGEVNEAVDALNFAISGLVEIDHSIIDFSNSGTGTLDFGGGNQEVKRFQTFIARTGYSNVTGLDVKILDNNANSGATFELYNVASNGMPTGSALASTSVAKTDVDNSISQNNGIVHVVLNYSGLTAGNKYAIALGQATEGNGSHDYKWYASADTSNPNWWRPEVINPQIQQDGQDVSSGKYDGANWVDESRLGDYWLRVYTERPVIHNITIEYDGNGVASSNYSSAAIGTEVTLTATPDEGYRLREWQVNYPAGLTITGNTFTMPAEAVSVKAIFEPNPVASYTLTVNGSYASGTGAGSYTEGSTVTIDAGSRSNYTFGGWSSGEGVTFANPNSPVTTFTMPAGNVAVTAAWNYSGGSGGSNQDGSGTPVTPANNYTADIVLPDASGSGTLNAKLPLTVNEKTGTAVLDTSANKDLAASGGTSVITVPAIPGVKAYTLSIPVSSLTTADWEGAVKVNTTAGSITIPSNMLSGVTGAAGAKAEVTIALGDRTILTGDAKAAVGDRPLLELYLSIDGKRIEWNSTAAPVNVSIPYAPSAAELSNPERIVIWYIDDSGKAHAVPNGRYDAATGKVNFTTTHFSHYAVGYNGISFKDVPDTAWYSKAVGYVAARGITSGKGNGSFSPNAKLTRGEFLVMVMKAYGFTPDENAANNFTDAGNTYYTGYLAAAKRLGISGGVGNNMFAPGKEITRQEMFTMLYNALKAIGELPQGHSGKTLSSFEDAGRIAAYAKEAMTYFVEAGIMEGNAGQLTPASTTTRAQLAQVLYNLLSRQ